MRRSSAFWLWCVVVNWASILSAARSSIRRPNGPNLYPRVEHHGHYGRPERENLVRRCQCKHADAGGRELVTHGTWNFELNWLPSFAKSRVGGETLLDVTWT